MLDEIAVNRVPRSVGYIIMFLGMFSLILSALFFFEELLNRFYTEDMAPGGYLGSAIPTFIFGVVVLLIDYIICPGAFRRKEMEASGEIEKSEVEDLQDIL